MQHSRRLSSLGGEQAFLQREKQGIAEVSGHPVRQVLAFPALRCLRDASGGPATPSAGKEQSLRREKRVPNPRVYDPRPPQGIKGK